MNLNLLNNSSKEEYCCCQSAKKGWKNGMTTVMLFFALVFSHVIYAATPTVSTFFPAAGAQGQVVTIVGANFTGTTAVSFGLTPASSFTVVNDNTISAVVGAGSTGSVRVTNPSGFGQKSGFTFYPAPSCNLSGILKACLADGNIAITTTVQFSTGEPTLNYSFPAGPQNTSGAFLVSTGPFNYDPINDIGTQTTIINPGTSGGQILFQLNVLNDGGECTCSKSVTIIDLGLEAYNNSIVCFGGTTSLFADATSSGSSKYTFTLQPGNIVIGPQSDPSVEFQNIPAGNYTVTVVDNNGCSKQTQVTIEQPPLNPVILNCPENKFETSCKTQSEINDSFAVWLASFSYSGGTNPVLTILPSNPMAPLTCSSGNGNSIQVTWTVTDQCGQPQSCTRTFTVNPSTAVDVAGPESSVSSACDYENQAGVDAAFALWLAQFQTVNDGCDATAQFNISEFQAPRLCLGGSVSLTYSISDNCSQDSVSATFTVNPSTAVDVAGPESSVSSACDYENQAGVDAAFALWLAQFQTVNDGCDATAQFNISEFQAPRLCLGGSVSLTYSISDNCSQDSVSATFTVNPSTAVDVAGPESSVSSACDYENQAGVDAAFALWLAQFQTVNDGCDATAQFNISEFQAPRLCLGGSVSLIYSISDNCSQDSVSATFTVTSPPQVVFNCGNNVTVPSCSSQDEVNSAWTTFLASTTASGGCNGVLTNNAPANAPSLCGGYVDVTWTYTVGSCGQQSGCGDHNAMTCTKRFTIASPSQVVFNTGNNVTVPACSTQSEVNSAWATFLASTTASGGCGGVLTNNAPAYPPSTCGGYVDVTWSYSVATCGQQSGCGNQNSTTITRRFTVASPSQVVFNTGNNVTVPACSAQSEVNSAWATFLASTTASGGCGGVLTNNAPAYPPSTCGGYVDVTWRYSVATCGQQSGCGNQNSTTITRRFTVASPSQVVFNAGNNVTVPACSTQAQINAAWTAFKASTTASGGCGGVLTNNAPAYPPSTCGGYVDVTWRYSVATCGQQSGCGNQNSTTITRRFTVASPSQVVFNTGNNVTVPACSAQSEVNSAWATFLASTTASGGCGGVLTNNAPAYPPSTCGGYVDVTWRYSVATCGQQSGCGNQNSTTITRRFTVASPSQVVFNAGNNVTVPACSTQAQINAAWTAFKASTTASGGCGGVLTNNAPAYPPSTCGGYVDVTWRYSVASCGQQSGCGNQNSTTITRRFTVASPSQVVFNAGNNVTVPACSTQSEVNSAWATFLASTTASGGCGGVLTNNAPAYPPSTCGGYVDVTWSYSVATSGQQSGCGNQNSTTITRRFRVASPSQVVFNAGNNVTVPACSTQAQINAAWTAFKASTTASGGCGGVLTNNAPAYPPSTCGGYVDVTWRYSVASCGQQSGCGNQNSTTITRRFTVASPSQVVFNAGNNVTVPACSTQAQINAAWTAFKASTTASGGCGGVLTNNAPTYPPSTCGGYVDVTWSYSSSNSCNQSTCSNHSNHGNQTCTKRFTVSSGSAVDVTGPTSVTYNGCDFTSQYALNCAFNNWLSQFRTLSSGCPAPGCGPSGNTAVFSGSPRFAPSLNYGGTVNVTYSITGSCNQDSFCATFTVTRPQNCNSTCKIPEPVVKSELIKGITIKAYPNPFTESFNIAVITASYENVEVSVFDMTGKQLERKEVNPIEVSELQMGDRYPSGVYNIVVTQGNEVKTLRVIKR